MKSKSLEPGILTILIWTLALQLLMLVNSQVLPALANPMPGATSFYRYLPIMILVLMLAALLVPSVRRVVLPWHLLVLLFADTAAILASRYLGFGPGESLSGSLVRSFFVWDQVIFLVIPLALIAWQFSLREVIWFCIFTAVFDIGIGFMMMDIPVMAVTHSIPAEGLRSNFIFQVQGSAVAVSVPFMAFQVMSAFIRSLVLGILGVVEHRIMTLQRRQRTELVEANEKLTHYALAIEQLTVSRERNRMARELHDTLAHTLSSVAVELEAVKTLVKRKPGEALKLVDQSLGITRNGLNETRKALQDLRALPIDDLGLTLALKTQAESVAERGELKLAAQIARGMDKLPADMAYCIYRVAQEGLENVIRHAGARNASLHLVRRDGRIQLTIQDDGCGFDQHSVDDRERFGLRGMCERAEMLGGRLIVDSKPGKGTTIRLELPEAA